MTSVSPFTVDDAIAAGAFPLHVSTETYLAFAKHFENVFGPSMLMFQDFMRTNFPQLTIFLKKFVTDRLHPMSAEMPIVSDAIDVIYCFLMYFVLCGVFYVIGRVTGKCSLRYFGIVHNAFLAVLSLYMGVALIWDMYALHGFKQWNNDLTLDSPIAVPIRNTMWLFIISKLYEYIDTFIMMLKHNYRQVSFLHMYHHSTVFLGTWTFFVYSPGGDGTWEFYVNSLIHVIMYIYYMLNLIFRTGPGREFLQRHKFIITRCQLTQFVLDAIHNVYILFIAFPVKGRKEPMWFNFWYMVTMIVLFMNFMIKNQRLAAKKRRENAASIAKKNQ